MPELPEVETVVADLRPHLVGMRITACDLRFPSIVRHPEPPLFVLGVSGRTIEALTRRGKYILIHLGTPRAAPGPQAEDGTELLVVHLGMTGQLRYVEADAPLMNHTHAVFDLDSGAQLRFRDPRRFGRLLFGTARELAAGRKIPLLGPEPIDPEFTARDLFQRLRGRRAPIKAMLLDQRVMAGVGNIYADESCFRARVRPDRPAGGLSRRAVGRLHAALRDALLQGIVNRGSSISDYVDAWGGKGSQQEALQVYGQAGRPCPNCSRPLSLVRLAGRSTVFCRRCQR